MGRKNFIDEDIDRVLMMLRAGPLDTLTMIERTGDERVYYVIRECTRRGLIARLNSDPKFGAVYKLTDKGRAACPTRRSFFRSMIDSLEQPTRRDLKEMGLA